MRDRQGRDFRPPGHPRNLLFRHSTTNTGGNARANSCIFRKEADFHNGPAPPCQPDTIGIECLLEGYEVKRLARTIAVVLVLDFWGAGLACAQAGMTRADCCPAESSHEHGARISRATPDCCTVADPRSNIAESRWARSGLPSVLERTLFRPQIDRWASSPPRFISRFSNPLRSTAFCNFHPLDITGVLLI